MDWSRAFSGIKDRLLRGAESVPSTPAELLRSTRLFRQLDATAFASLCQSAQSVSVNEGDLIVEEGGVGDALFVLQSGAVRVFTVGAGGEEIVLARLEAGRYFGEQALLHDPPRTRNASVRAVAPVQLLRISSEQIAAALAHDRSLRQTLEAEGTRQLVEKLSRTSAIFRSLTGEAAHSVGGRVREFADGSTIFAQGDAADAAFVVLSGTVEIQLDGDAVTRLGAGQIFGELGVLKQQPRAGTAVARGPVRVLAIDRARFRQMHDETPELRELTATLERVYEVPQRGIVSLHRTAAAGAETINSVFSLNDGRVVLGSHVVGRDLVSMTLAGATADETVRFAAPGGTREMAIGGNRLVGISSTGPWDQVGRACRLLLDGTPLQAWQVPLFQRMGDLTADAERPGSDPAETCCHCMSVSRGAVLDAVRAGASSLEAVSGRCGAGTICGGCHGEIASLLGAAPWSMVRVDQHQMLAPDIIGVTLRPYEGAVAPHAPGQYCLLQALIGRNWIERAYTLTAASQAGYEIAVKREPAGLLSRWLCEQAGNQPLLRLSTPYGAFTLDVQAPRPAVAIVAGIGVTPAVAFARAVASAEGSRRLHIDYSARTAEDRVFGDELDALAGRRPQISVRLRTTSRDGRLTGDAIADVLSKHPDAEYFVCGPEAFMEQVCAKLASCGVPPAAIRVELFTPAGGPAKTT